MDENDDIRRYDAGIRNERVKSRNLSEKKRRDQFNMLINELSTLVSSSSRKMDKSSVLRSTISFLRNHRELSVQQHSMEIHDSWKPIFLSNEEFTHIMLEGLRGFIIAFSCAGQILYTSEGIASLLGYLPANMCSSVFDMIHEYDRASLHALINSPTENVHSLTVHMKHGPIYSQETTSYELIRLIGTFHHWPSSSSSPPGETSSVCNVECDSNSCSSICSPLSSATVDWPLCFVAMAKLQIPKLLHIVNLPDESNAEFTSRHSFEWTFLFLDHRAPPIIGYLPFEILGTSGYDYYHADDLESIASCHEMLMQTGEGTSCLYRFLTKSQQWVWLQTRYFISYHQWNSKPEFIVCKNVVIRNEQVQKSISKVPKTSAALARKPSFSNQTFSCNRSACVSPTLSASSRGSLSSEHAFRHSVAKDRRKQPQFNTEPSAHTTVSGQTPSVPTSPTKQSSTSFAFNQSYGHTSVCTSPTSKAAQVLHPSPTSKASIQSPFGRTQAFLPSASLSSLSSQCQTTSNMQPTSVIESNQAQFQDYLKRRHQTLQQQILLQQEELQRVSEQLMLVQCPGPNTIPHSSTIYQPTYPVTESINSAYNVRNLPQLRPTSAESGNFIGQDSRLQETLISSNVYVHSQPCSHLPYSSQDMNIPISQEPGIIDMSTYQGI